jgi:drug/metabolite transporter (DMT)-like permease
VAALALIRTVAVLIASASYAVSVLYQRRKLRGMNVYEASFGQLALTVLLVVPFAAPAVPSAHFHDRSESETAAA